MVPPAVRPPVNTEEKRRGVEALGSELIVRRWIVAFAHILFQKMILIPGELARKMGEGQYDPRPTLRAQKQTRRNALDYPRVN